MKMDEYINLDATDMAGLIQKKEVHPEELLKLAFQRLETINPLLNAVVHDRKEQVLAEAKGMADIEKPFSGVPLLVKNLSQSVAGEPITSSAQLKKRSVSEHDSHFVKKLRDCGFLLMGHTNTPEFGLKNITEPKLYGATHNPWNTDRSPGGSSGGAAAAVAAGIVPAAGASDGGGSIRIPASWTGLFGLKPTRGRTPVGPGAGRKWQGAAIDFALTKSVRDSASMLDQLQVVQPEAAFQTPLFEGNYKKKVTEAFKRPLRIAFTTESPVGTSVSREAKNAVNKTVKWLEAEGHHVEEKKANIDDMSLIHAYYMMNSGEISAVVKKLENTIGRFVTANDLEIEAWLLYTAGQSVTAADYSMSLGVWDQAAAQMAEFHRTYDLYVTPATAFSAPEVGELTYSLKQQHQFWEDMRQRHPHEQQDLIFDVFLPGLTYTPFSHLANLTGQPAASVPVHQTRDGMPIGVQIMAGKGQEDLIFKLAGDIEQSNLWSGMTGNPYMSEY